MPKTLVLATPPTIAVAQDALYRSDTGPTHPGDTTLIAAYDNHCQQQWHNFQRKAHQAERAAWLATRCRYCGPVGATGDCGDCPEGDTSHHLANQAVAA